MTSEPSTAAPGQPMMHHFHPYSDNGGTTVAVAGKDFVVVASDTRLSEGYSIYTREQSKIFNLTDNTVLLSTGCWCDVITFVKVLQARIKFYNYDHRKAMSTGAVAQLVSTMLYGKRFFPYYISNMVAGIDENGVGCVYDYDPVGCFERLTFHSVGSSAPLIQPFLDSVIGQLNQKKPVEKRELTEEYVKSVIKDAFVSAGERDIYVGDGVHIQVIRKDGGNDPKAVEYFPLRKD